MSNLETPDCQDPIENPPRVFIAGGSGFVGSHLSDYLIAKGFEVLCADSLLTGKRENISHLLSHPRFTFMHVDVTESVEVDGPIDYVINLASPAGLRDCMRHPIETLEAGALGTRNVLNLAKDKGAVFLFASSSEVYGDPEVNPQPETYWGHVNSVGPRSMYDEAKRFAEALATAYARAYGLQVRIVRIFNTYGPRMRVGDGRVVPNFMSQALKHEPLTVYGDGSQTRSLCYVDDLVVGLHRLLLYDDGPKNEPVIVNLGNPEEVTVLQLAREIIEVTGSRSEITFEPLPGDDPRLRRPDITRARQLLGWEPKVSRKDGLKRLVPYFTSVSTGKGVVEHRSC